jgi:DNA-binding NarL/FixJ family response regulator
MTEIRVAIFEDHKLVKEALEAILNGTAGYTCCGAYGSGANWEQDVKRSNPDVILMDIEMPGKDGIELTGLISRSFPEIKILIQTVFEDSEKIFRALCSGASGYILKTDPPQKYLEAITDVYNGGAPINTSIAKKVLGFFANKNVILAMPGNDTYELSTREHEILKHIVTGRPMKEIAATLFISYDTIRTHTKHIYKKMQVASRSEAALKAMQQGLV